MQLLQQLINGLTIGLGYALVTLGYNLTFGVLRIVNLAYGEIFMIASYGFVVVFAATSSLLTAMTAGVTVAALIGVLVHLVAVHPLGDISAVDAPEHMAVLVSTIGASVLIRNGVLAAFGAQPRPFPALAGERTVSIGALTVPLSVIVSGIMALILVLALYALLARSTFGLQLRAIADNRDLARINAIPVMKIVYATIAVSAMLAGIAAIIVCDIYAATSPVVGVSYGLKALIAVIAGGLGNIRRCTWIATALGIGEALSAGYVSAAYRDVIVLGTLVTMIIVRDSFRAVRQST